MTDADRTAAILRARAADLARVRAAPPGGDRLEIVEFSLAGERYGLELARLREVQPLGDLTPIPCTPPFVVGVVSVRGRIVAVLDLGLFFDLPRGGLHDLHRVLVVEADGLDVGILADDVAGSRTVPLADLRPPPATLTGARRTYVRGVTADGLAILDAAQILAEERVVVREEVSP